MTSWLRIRPAALLTGLALGTAIQEALRSAVDAFVLLGTFGDRLVGGPSASVSAILMVTALIGGAVAGTVTALLSGCRWTATGAGVFLAASSVAIAAIAFGGGAGAALHAVPPVCGAAIGARLALGPASPAGTAEPADTGR